MTIRNGHTFHQVFGGIAPEHVRRKCPGSGHADRCWPCPHGPTVDHFSRVPWDRATTSVTHTDRRWSTPVVFNGLGFRESRCSRRPTSITAEGRVARREHTLGHVWANHPEQAAQGKPRPPARARTGGLDQSTRRGDLAGEGSVMWDLRCPALIDGYCPET